MSSPFCKYKIGADKKYKLKGGENKSIITMRLGANKI